jgi:hypothetical protein
MRKPCHGGASLVGGIGSLVVFDEYGYKDGNELLYGTARGTVLLFSISWGD